MKVHALAIASACGFLAPLCLAQTDPVIFGYWNLRHWNYQRYLDGLTPCSPTVTYPYTGVNQFVHIQHFDLTATHSHTECDFEALVDASAPVAMTLKGCRVPFPDESGGACSSPYPDSVYDALAHIDSISGGYLDYVFMDLEGPVTEYEWTVANGDAHNGDEISLEAVVAAVRAYVDADTVNLHNTAIGNARIGNYNYMPGDFNTGSIWPSASDRTFYATNYADLGLDVAMPACYMSSTDQVLTTAWTTGHFGTTFPGLTYDSRYEPYLTACPTIRASYYYNTLELLSVAARALPETDLLIPWTNTFHCYDDPAYAITNASDMPTLDDMATFVQHARLRRSHSFYFLEGQYYLATTWTPPAGTEVTDADYLVESLDKWDDLDADFSVTEEPEFLELTNDKGSGLFVSGARFGDDVVALASNFSGASETIDFETRFGILTTSTASTTVTNNGHNVVRFTVNAAVRDLDGDGDFDFLDYDAFHDRITTVTSRYDYPDCDIDGDGDIDQDDIDDLEAAESTYTPPCPADMTTTGGASPGQPGYGIPDGSVGLDDFSYFLALWLASDPIADLTTTGGVTPGQPGVGVPDGMIDLDDLGYFNYFWLTPSNCP
ncbi:MAG: GC-type dockerin domain-anchored protein [Planctomycetota bacterium]